MMMGQDSQWNEGLVADKEPSLIDVVNSASG